MVMKILDWSNGEGYACGDTKLCEMREYSDCVRRIKDVVLI
jgi:hypothetical protein